MYHSIPIAFTLSSFYLGNIIAAPAALPPKGRDAAPSPTATTPYASTVTAATPPIMERAEPELGSLGDLVAPQKISSSASATTSTTSAFLLDVTPPPEANNKPVKLVVKEVQHEARQQDPSFGSLDDLSFPQKVSSASANASSTSTVFELSPARSAAPTTVALDV